MAGVTPCIFIFPPSPPKDYNSLCVPLHRLLFGDPPISNTLVLPTVTLQSPPFASCQHSLAATITTIQHPILTLVVSPDSPCPSRDLAQPSLRSSCVFAAARLTGSLLILLAATPVTYISIVTWSFFFSPALSISSTPSGFTKLHARDREVFTYDYPS